MRVGTALSVALLLSGLAAACAQGGGFVADVAVLGPAQDGGVGDVASGDLGEGRADVDAKPAPDPGVADDGGVEAPDVEEETFVSGPPCTEDDEGPCTITNEHGSCRGEIVCLGERGLAPCDARAPAAELCNAIDDDCDGETDEGLLLCDCGDGTCAVEGGETVELCPCDCRECGDGVCSPCGESPSICQEDCCRTPQGANVCGDGYCMSYGCGEDPSSCPEDCGRDCGNGACERGEEPFGCPEDCKRGECGNGTCEPTDGGPFACPSDCAPDCGDCVCERGESWIACPGDCGFCGDGVCSECPAFGESEETCPVDCCVPVAEADSTCDGVDDDCDGAVDEDSCDDDDPCTTDICGVEGACSHDLAEGVCGASGVASGAEETRIEDAVGGVTVVVPTDAVSDEVEISVAPAPEHEGSPVDGESEGVVVRSAWSFEPDGLVFEVPVEITLPVRGEPLPAGSRVLIVTYDRESEAWLPATMTDGSEVFGRVSEDGLSLTFAVDHFSEHAFARPEGECEPACGERECGRDGCGGACGDCGGGVCIEGGCCHPEEERCDGRDNDCDGDTDEAVPESVCENENEHGSCPGVTACEGGQVVCEGAVAAPELCDGEDDDCDGLVDEGFADTDEDGAADCVDEDDDNDGMLDAADNCPAQANGEQEDLDEDGMGDICDPDTDGDGSADEEDCAPTDSSVRPGAVELCGDEVDNDCNGEVDEANAQGCLPYYSDGDSDGYGVATDSSCLCAPSAHYVAPVAGDCDDASGEVHPGATEVCNDEDDDCDGEVDEGDVCAPEPSAHLVGAGSSFSMCAGQCVTDLTVGGAVLDLRISGWDDTLYLHNTGTLTVAGIQKEAELAAATLEQELQAVYGCPDCGDGGLSQVTLVRNGTESKHTYEYMNPPELLEGLDAFTGELIGGLRSCTSGTMLVVDEGCVPYGFDPDPPEGMCRSATDCAVYEVCHATGDPPLCGMCAMRENPCTEDAECEDGTVCDYQRGTEECPRCDPGKECVPPCADDGECPEGQLCHETGHCVDLTCSSARDCPALFVCKPGDPSVCRRATCQDQAPCPSGGRCVNDQCWQDFGTCETPPP